MVARAVEIQDIGPITKVSIPIPEEGGIVVLRGRNGAGKSQALGAVETALRGEGRLGVRDGALSGTLQGLGIELRVSRSTRRLGELEVATLDGRLSVAELVDPGLKSPEAADAKRIKALIQVAGVEADPSLFHGLLGSREAFEAIASSAATDATDLVVMADRIKRDCEAAARKKESDADHAEGRARGAREAAGDIDTDAESDAALLSKELEAAIRAEGELRASDRAAIEAESATLRARRQLEAAQSSYAGPSIEEATAKAESLAQVVEQQRLAANEAGEAVKKLAAQLEQAQRELEKQGAKLESTIDAASAAMDAQEAAKRHQSTIEAWEQQIAATAPVGPTDAELAAATSRVLAARQAVERGALIRHAHDKLEEAKAFMETALAHRGEAARLREAAKGTDDVLSGVVAQAGSALRVEAGRLVLTTGRGATFFSELSHGERWRLGLDVGIKAVGRGGLLVLPQEAWEGLDPMARENVADHIRGKGVVILTAECSSDDDVHAEVIK